MTEALKTSTVVACSVCKTKREIPDNYLYRFLYGNNVINEIKEGTEKAFQHPLDKHKMEVAAAVAKKMTSRNNDSRAVCSMVLTPCDECFRLYNDANPVKGTNIGSQDADTNMTAEDYQHYMAG